MANLECPHGCGAARESVEAMDEHVAAQHGDLRVVPGSRTTVPGEAEVPEDVLSEIEGMSNALTEVTHINQDMVMRQQRDAGLSWNGQLVPEFVTAWRPDGMKVKVHARRMWELIQKGFRFRAPSREEQEQTWFHWQCPIRSCPSHTKVCELHGRPGDDSNHHLRSEEYMIIDHLHSGGKVHRQFFEMHKKELADRYAEAWHAWEAQEAEAEQVSERQRTERERLQVAATAAKAGEE